MQASIERLAATPAANTYDDPAFRAILEDHLTWLINHDGTNTKPVTAHQVDVFDFDWIGLLQDLSVPADLHWITIRMNGGKSLTDVPQSLRALRVPSTSALQNLVQLSASTKKIR